MTEFLADALEFAVGHPALLAIVAVGLALVALVWAVVSSSYRYR